jgi:hypothetical protein
VKMIVTTKRTPYVTVGWYLGLHGFDSRPAGRLPDFVPDVAPYSKYCLRPLEHWDRRFESCSGHGCVSVFLCVVLSCVGREALALD